MIPILSAAVVVGTLKDRAERCLAALLEQTPRESMEIVLMDISPDGSALQGADHPSVRYFHRPDLASFASARAECVRQARGEIVAFLEDHTFPCPGWAAAVLEAFRLPVAVVNYALTNMNPDRYVSRAFFMTEYGPWMAPARRGPISFAACHNIAYRRKALEPYWEELDQLFEAEFLLHRRLLRSGATIWLEPGAVLSHETWTNLSDGVRGNGALKRLFADVRASEGGWSRGRRYLWAGGMILSPPLHLWRLVRTLWRRPHLWASFFVSLPVMLAVYTDGACREALGYLFGAGSSRQETMETELSVVREA
jgi:glycosyltransferase involved in cell wall biosynthesis